VGLRRPGTRRRRWDPVKGLNLILQDLRQSQPRETVCATHLESNRQIRRVEQEKRHSQAIIWATSVHDLIIENHIFGKTNPIFSNSINTQRF
jgi:hypothetical protein